MNIVFYNHFHNGDCFVSKMYVQDLIFQIRQHRPDIEFYYAHNNHPGIIADVAAEYVPAHAYDYDRYLRMGTRADDILINTWVGAWQGEIFNHGEHINYLRLHAIWRRYYAALGRLLNIELAFSDDAKFYVPYIDADYYRQDLIRNYMQGYAKKRKVLICNGPAKSGQSQMGDFVAEIDALSQEYPAVQFIATQRTGIRRLNVSHTADIFALDSDINEIALLSRHCDLIVGKNSGPYSFAHHRANMLDANKTFACFSTRDTDMLNAQQDWPAEFHHTVATDHGNVMAALRQLIDHVLTKPQAL
jgi:hypothetical protein